MAAAAANAAAVADLRRKGNRKQGAAVFLQEEAAELSKPAAVFPCTLDAQIYRVKGLVGRIFYSLFFLLWC